MKKRRTNKRIYSEKKFIIKFFMLFYWLFKDLKDKKKNPNRFKEFGLTIFTGRQGGGKTTGMVEYLERLRIKYPNALIVTNFGYKNEHYSFNDWNDLFNIRNGDYGVIFAIDEIQNEFSAAHSKSFPEALLGEITQQRKQKIKIVATSQVFTRVAKPLREQTYEVIECRTLFGRWTFMKCFDADEYNMMIDSNDINVKIKIPRKWRRNFIQDNALRDLFDSYAKVERIKRTEYIREVK